MNIISVILSTFQYYEDFLKTRGSQKNYSVSYELKYFLVTLQLLSTECYL